MGALFWENPLTEPLMDPLEEIFTRHALLLNHHHRFPPPTYEKLLQHYLHDVGHLLELVLKLQNER